MGKTRVIAETGAGQHGVATATAAALMGLECEIFMGKEDTDRQALNVYRMELLGAKVNAVTTGTMTLKDAVNEAMREWVSRVDDTPLRSRFRYGPASVPDHRPRFPGCHQQRGKRADPRKKENSRKPSWHASAAEANAMGMFYNFINDKNVRLIGCERQQDAASTPQRLQQPLQPEHSASSTV